MAIVKIIYWLGLGMCFVGTTIWLFRIGPDSLWRNGSMIILFAGGACFFVADLVLKKHNKRLQANGQSPQGED